jgi:hypothetical protein
MSWLTKTPNTVTKVAMITHVAIKDADGRIWSLPKPYRHGDVIKLIRQEQNAKYLLSDLVAGFLNDAGAFLTRQEAWHEAHRCNQILPPCNPIDPSQRAGKPSDKPGPLFSEDLW